MNQLLVDHSGFGRSLSYEGRYLHLATSKVSSRWLKITVETMQVLKCGDIFLCYVGSPLFSRRLEVVSRMVEHGSDQGEMYNKTFPQLHEFGAAFVEVDVVVVCGYAFRVNGSLSE
jgi:hypothetical protein